LPFSRYFSNCVRGGGLSGPRGRGYASRLPAPTPTIHDWTHRVPGSGRCFFIMRRFARKHCRHSSSSVLVQSRLIWNSLFRPCDALPGKNFVFKFPSLFGARLPSLAPFLILSDRIDDTISTMVRRRPFFFPKAHPPPSYFFFLGAPTSCLTAFPLVPSTIFFESWMGLQPAPFPFVFSSPVTSGPCPACGDNGPRASLLRLLGAFFTDPSLVSTFSVGHTVSFYLFAKGMATTYFRRPPRTLTHLIVPSSFLASHFYVLPLLAIHPRFAPVN